MQKYSSWDYQFFDCTVQNLIWNEENATLILQCQYMDRGRANICLKDVKRSEYMEIMQNHTIDYFIATYDGEKDTTCCEIHFKGLVEVTRVWAESMKFQ